MRYFNANRRGKWLLLAALASAPAFGYAAGTAQTGDANKNATPAASVVAPAAVLMLIPTDVAAKDSAIKSGCWAKIYSGTNYGGDTLTLAGPIAITDMSGPFGLNWDDKVDSVEVGPKATLTVFDNQQFRDQVAQFKPGQKIPDVSKRLGFFDEFASVRMSCAKA